MKLTQAQRADLLARLFVSRSSACAPVRDKLSYAKEMLQAYEAELAAWPPDPPVAYAVTSTPEGRSEAPVPLTEEQANALRDLPNKLDEDHHAVMNGPRIRQALPTEFMEALVKASKVRNPEEIDFAKYPILPGYTVASEVDVAAAKDDANWAFFANGWVINTPNSAGGIEPNWTYLRPLREDEK